MSEAPTNDTWWKLTLLGRFIAEHSAHTSVDWWDDVIQFAKQLNREGGNFELMLTERASGLAELRDRWDTLVGRLDTERLTQENADLKHQVSELIEEVENLRSYANRKTAEHIDACADVRRLSNVPRLVRLDLQDDKYRPPGRDPYGWAREITLEIERRMNETERS
jgi:hypothetical protein